MVEQAGIGVLCGGVELRARAEHGASGLSNTDPGVLFTSVAHIGVLKKAGVRISMDGRDRVPDHIVIERLWRSVKDAA